MATEIAVGLAVFAAAKTEDRVRREAEEQRREEERRRREIRARAEYVEGRRVTALTAILGELDELDRLRRLMASLMAEQTNSEPPRVSTFLRWAKEHLADREARFSTKAMEQRFEGEHLFGDSDDRGFNPWNRY